MKILQVVHGWPGFSFGGTEVFAHALTRELATRHGVEVFCRIADNSLDEYELRVQTVEGIRLHSLNNRLAQLGSFEMLYRNPQITAKFRAVLEDVRPEVVHVHHLYLLSSDLLAAIREAGVPIVMTLHDYWMICQKGQLRRDDGTNCAEQVDANCDTCLPNASSLAPAAVRASRALDRWVPGFSDPDSKVRTVVRNAYTALQKGSPAAGPEIDRIVKRQSHLRQMLDHVDLFVAPSRYLLDKYVAFGVDPEKIVHSDYGIALDRLAAAPQAKVEPVRFGYLGSLIPSKGVHVLVEAYRQVRETKAPLSIAGGFGSDPGIRRYEEQLKRLVAGEDVVLSGRYKSREIGKLLSNLDVLIVPSLWQENSPVVIHEAMACGVPVVASRIGGIPELVTDGVDGRLFEAGNAQELAQILTELCDQGAVETLRLGIKTVKRIADNALEYEQFYARARKTAIRSDTQVNPLVYVIVLNLDSTEDSLKCIASLKAGDYANQRILVVDNGSTKQPVEQIRAVHPDIEYLELPENLGYTGGNNAGIRLAQQNGAAYFLLLNSDATVAPDTLSKLVAAGEADPQTGILGTKVYHMARPDVIQSAGSRFDPATGRAVQLGFDEPDQGQYDDVREVDGVMGCSIMAKTEAVEAAGMLNDDYFWYFEETDWCLRVQAAGWRIAVVQSAKVWHKGWGSTGGRQTPIAIYYGVRNQLLIVKHHGTARNALLRFSRQLRVIVLGVAYLLLRSDAPKSSGMRHLFKGVRDYYCGRLGKLKT